MSPNSPVSLSTKFTGDHTGATFGDYDGDGNLDLFVAGYINLDLKNAPALRLQDRWL